LKIYERSQEVIENKGSRWWKAKRSLKTKKLTAESQEVIDGKRFNPFPKVKNPLPPMKKSRNSAILAARNARMRNGPASARGESSPLGSGGVAEGRGGCDRKTANCATRNT
jgi:hypothetical protein